MFQALNELYVSVRNFIARQVMKVSVFAGNLIGAVKRAKHNGVKPSFVDYVKMVTGFALLVALFLVVVVAINNLFLGLIALSGGSFLVALFAQFAFIMVMLDMFSTIHAMEMGRQLPSGFYAA